MSELFVDNVNAVPRQLGIVTEPANATFEGGTGGSSGGGGGGGGGGVVTTPPAPTGYNGHGIVYKNFTYGNTADNDVQGNNSDWAEMDAKYGHLGCARVYSGGAPPVVNAPSLLKDGRTIVSSFKGNAGDAHAAYLAMTSGKYDAGIHADLAQYSAGQKVYYTFWHEPENDFRISSSDSTPAEYAACITYLYNLVQSFTDIACEYLVGMIFTSYIFGPSTHDKIADYWPNGIVPDFLGIDVDGLPIDPKNSQGVVTITKANHDFRPEMAAGTAYARSRGTKRFLIGEFGQGRIDADTTGSIRAAWMAQQCAAFEAIPCETIVLYDQSNMGSNASGGTAYFWTPGSPEVSFWTSKVSQYGYSSL